ncbi:MAG: hypothetical protein KGJ62_09635 [Armatimonadetes bacterium]|nr:hypothetical protein [Armatimonadota bacterium]MDE2205793.1 hypothetical protein [Armatimonadota bacterium]
MPYPIMEILRRLMPRRRRSTRIAFEEVGEASSIHMAEPPAIDGDSEPIIVEWLPLPGAAVCAVTREPLKPGESAMRCAACGMLFSVDGWAFLERNAGGCCCGCGANQRAEPCTMGSRNDA